MIDTMYHQVPKAVRLFKLSRKLKSEPKSVYNIDGKDDQCGQKKIAKCLKKLPKNDFTTKMIDFDTPTKIA